MCIHSATGRSEPDVDNHLANEGPVNTLCWVLKDEDGDA